MRSNVAVARGYPTAYRNSPRAPAGGFQGRPASSPGTGRVVRFPARPRIGPWGRRIAGDAGVSRAAVRAARQALLRSTARKTALAGLRNLALLHPYLRLGRIAWNLWDLLRMLQGPRAGHMDWAGWEIELVCKGQGDELVQTYNTVCPQRSLHTADELGAVMHVGNRYYAGVGVTEPGTGPYAGYHWFYPGWYISRADATPWEAPRYIPPRQPIWFETVWDPVPYMVDPLTQVPLIGQSPHNPPRPWPLSRAAQRARNPFRIEQTERGPKTRPSEEIGDAEWAQEALRGRVGGVEAVVRWSTDGKSIEKTRTVARRRPKKKGEREKKARASWYGRGGFRLLAIAEIVGEGVDLVDAFYSALPWYIRAEDHTNRPYGITPQEKLWSLYRNWGKLDLEDALDAVVENEIEDRLYANVGRGLRIVAEQVGMPVGFQWSGLVSRAEVRRLVEQAVSTEE